MCGESACARLSAPPPLLAPQKHSFSCDIYPPLVAWMFGNIWSTGPGEAPQHTGIWCITEGRETWVQWPAGERPPLGWRCTAGCFDTLFPWRWSCCIYKVVSCLSLVLTLQYFYLTLKCTNFIAAERNHFISRFQLFIRSFSSLILTLSLSAVFRFFT